MQIRHCAARLGLLGMVIWLVSGCSVDQLSDPEPRFETLTVAFGDAGPSPSPCDDALPVIDGVAQDVEWDIAEPLFVRMSGADGNGGRDFFLEVRAIWSNERVYFLVRYEDDDFDNTPDELAYIHPQAPGEICDNYVLYDKRVYCTSPVPVRLPPPNTCDPILTTPSSWTRLNQGGREDQVMVLLQELPGADAVSVLPELNGKLLGVIGPEAPTGVTLPEGANTEVWVWRAGRCNLHPVPQFPDPSWEPDLLTKLIPPEYSRFPTKTGFAEDLWVDGSGNVVADAGRAPYVKNFGRTDLTGSPVDIPDRLTECPIRTREPTEEELAAQNGGIPKDLGLWWPSTTRFSSCDSLACSRSGSRVRKWSQGLLEGEYDKVQGWALQVPYTSGLPTSSRDVRARGTHEETQEKGFSVWTIEFMRNLDTGNSDDLPIQINTQGEYRMVIGVLDASGKVGSGSTEIRLRFAPRVPRQGLVTRC